MGVWESQSIEKNFDEIVQEIEKMKELTTSKFKKLEESTGLAKIKHLSPLKLAEFSVRRSEHRDGWYNDKPILRVEWNSSEIDKLVQQGGLLNGVNYKENWHYTYVFFDESKNDALEKWLVLFVQLQIQIKTSIFRTLKR